MDRDSQGRNPRREVTLAVAVFVLAGLAFVAAAADMETVRPASQRGLYNVVETGAVGDGQTDATDAFQRALDAAKADGGGLVTAPTGTFLIKRHLVIPSNVTLEGVWRSPQRGLPVEAGTTLLAVEGKGTADGPPFIAMDTNATIKGIAVLYPEQTHTNPPIEYPWTIGTTGYTDNCTILDVTLINPYQAVDFGTHATGRHFINGLYAYPLFKGLYINECYDVGRIENIHFWPFWDTDPNSPLWVFTKEKATAFIIGKTDGEMAFNCFSIFYNVGMHFIRGPIEGKPGHTSPGSGVYTNCYMDVTPCAIRVDDVGAHSGVSFVNGMFMSRVEIGPANKGPVKFTACGFWDVKGLDCHANVQGRGAVFFESCHFSGWDQEIKGAPCIDADCRRLVVTGCDFETERTDHVKVRLGSEVQAAVITSNLMPGGVLIENNAPPSASIQIGLNAGEGS